MQLLGVSAQSQSVTKGISANTASTKFFRKKSVILLHSFKKTGIIVEQYEQNPHVTNVSARSVYFRRSSSRSRTKEWFAAIRVIEQVGSVAPIDCLIVHEDMAGKSGPLYGPSQIREFFKPYYSRVWEAAKAYGAKLFSMDSDGDMSPILGDLIDCGLNAIHPVEPVGGNDIVQLRKKYGKKLFLKGGIDKHALVKGPDAVKAELEYRLDPCLRGGGTVFGLDHRIPNGVHIDTYRYYVNLGREMLGLEPISGEGWARMAF